jgi:hypothetical protein
MDDGSKYLQVSYEIELLSVYRYADLFTDKRYAYRRFKYVLR